MSDVEAYARTGGVQSVERALRILEVLGSEHAGLRLSEVARRVALAPSTTHRLLTTMEQRGFVYFSKQFTTWFVGREAFRTGAAFARRRAFVKPAMPLMRVLRDATRETVNMGQPEDGSIVILAQVESRDVVRVVNTVGGRAPLSSCGLGKAIMATYSDSALEQHIRAYGVPRLTRYTPDNPADLLADLRLVRERGYAIDREEHLLGLHCVAAPIFDQSGDAVAAMSVSAPAGKAGADRNAELGRLVVKSANEVTSSIGGVRPGTWSERPRNIHQPR